MENERMIRTTKFGGFLKEDVIAYIEQVNKQSKAREDVLNQKYQEQKHITEQFAENEIALQEKIAALDIRLEQEEKNHQSMMDEYVEAVSQLQMREQEVQQLQEQVAALQESAQKTRSIAEEQERERRNEQQKKQSSQIEEIGAQIGSVIVEANQYADQVVSAAKDTVLQLSTNSFDGIDSLSAEINDYQAQIETVRQEMGSLLEEMTNKLSSLGNALQSVSQQLQPENVSKEVETAVSKIQYPSLTDHFVPSFAKEPEEKEEPFFFPEHLFQQDESLPKEEEKYYNPMEKLSEDEGFGKLFFE